MHKVTASRLHEPAQPPPAGASQAHASPGGLRLGAMWNRIKTSLPLPLEGSEPNQVSTGTGEPYQQPAIPMTSCEQWSCL